MGALRVDLSLKALKQVDLIEWLSSESLPDRRPFSLPSHRMSCVEHDKCFEQHQSDDK
jgi:hypothetical protein